MSRLCQQVNSELGTNGPMRKGETDVEKTIRERERGIEKRKMDRLIKKRRRRKELHPFQSLFLCVCVCGKWWRERERRNESQRKDFGERKETALITNDVSPTSDSASCRNESLVSFDSIFPESAHTSSLYRPSGVGEWRKAGVCREERARGNRRGDMKTCLLARSSV